jgi:hypothetical protein
MARHSEQNSELLCYCNYGIILVRCPFRDRWRPVELDDILRKRAAIFKSDRDIKRQILEVWHDFRGDRRRGSK